jgi:hypothetical protein
MSVWPSSGFPTYLFPLQPPADHPYTLVDTAISGGNLEQYLRDAMTRANGLVCAMVTPIRMTFPLPCPSGSGTTVSAAELEKRKALSPSYFSEDLCCNYLQYQEDGPHMLLFDDETSLQRKCALVSSLRIPFLLFSGEEIKKQPSD